MPLERYAGTVDGEGVRVADVARSVRSYACVLARVPRGYGLDAESAHVLIYLRDRDIRIVRPDRAAVKPPSDLYGKVAFRDRTRGRNHVTPIRRSVVNRERRYVRHNYNYYNKTISYSSYTCVVVSREIFFFLI